MVGKSSLTKYKRTKYFSFVRGELCEGCQFCVKGRKLVLFITGICPRSCWYCPLSEKRKDLDFIFVNEWKTDSLKNLEKEVKLCQSYGCGITGGDPLSRIARTLEYIRFLKEKFGAKFHIHLYTSLNLVSKGILKRLYEAGLDEIRFHLDLYDDKLWGRLVLAREYDWKVGVEVPVIPGLMSVYKKMISFIDKKVDFLNLNELEISDLNAEEMYRRGFVEKNDVSYAIKGSLELGKTILRLCDQDNLQFVVHLCSSKLKDKVQMQNRFRLRAESIKTKFDIVTDEGLLLRGVIMLKEVVEKRNFEKERDMIVLKMKRIYNFLNDEGLDLIFEKKKLRFITYLEHVEQFAELLKRYNLIPMIVEEDPTVEGLIVNKYQL